MAEPRLTDEEVSTLATSLSVLVLVLAGLRWLAGVPIPIDLFLIFVAASAIANAIWARRSSRKP